MWNPRSDSERMEYPRLRQLNETARCIELKDPQPNANFCIGLRPAQSLEVGYVRQRRVDSSGASRPSVILFHGSLDKGSTAYENEQKIPPTPNMQLLEESDHEESSPDSHEDIDDSRAKQKSVSPDLSLYEAKGECGCSIKKRHRTSFNSFQLKRLEEEFDGDNYIIGMKRWRLSDEIEIPEKQIKIWFQNRRTKSKKHCNSKGCRRHTSKLQCPVKFI